MEKLEAIDRLKKVLETEGEPTEDFAWFDAPYDRQNWIFSYTNHGGAGLLSQSNFEVISTDLLEYVGDEDDPDVVVGGFSHWLVGNLDRILVRAFDEDEKPTQAALELLGWIDSLEAYPVADESYYYELEYQASVSNIVDIARDIDFEEYGVAGDLHVDTVFAADIYEWLRDNDEYELESTDDQGAWPSEESIAKAVSEVACVHVTAALEAAGQHRLFA